MELDVGGTKLKVCYSTNGRGGLAEFKKFYLKGNVLYLHDSQDHSPKGNAQNRVKFKKGHKGLNLLWSTSISV